MSGDLGRWALAYAVRKGWPVFPCVPRTKKPLIRDHLGAATTDPGLVEAWWREWPEAGIGIPLGRALLGSLDFDTDEAYERFAELECEHGPLGVGLTVLTARGQRIYFHHSGAVRLVRSLGAGLEVRSGSCFDLMPPSWHPTGAAYAIADRARVDPLTLPAAWLELLRKPAAATRSSATPAPSAGHGAAYAARALAREGEAVRGAEVGARHYTLNRSAYSLGQLVAAGLIARERVEAELAADALAAGVPGDDVERIITSGLDAGVANPRTARGAA